MKTLKHRLDTNRVQILQLLDLLQRFQLCLPIHLYRLYQPITDLFLFLLPRGLVASMVTPANRPTDIALKEATLAVVEKLVDPMTFHELFQFDLLNVSFVCACAVCGGRFVGSDRGAILVLAKAVDRGHIVARLVIFVLSAAILTHFHLCR